MNKFLKNQQGFTLVELMVVVAIIAILSTIAIPNFRKFQAKAKTSEAKLHLSSIYSAEVAFLSDADVYATCLNDMGYNPSGQAAQRYYSTGFNAAVVSTFIDNTTNIVNGVTCDTAVGEGISFFAAGKTTGGKDIILQDDINNTLIGANGEAFLAAAQGWISPSFIKENASIFKKPLDMIVGEAYAQSTTTTTITNETSGCDTGGTKGGSLYTINDEKSLTSICNGY